MKIQSSKKTTIPRYTNIMINTWPSIDANSQNKHKKLHTSRNQNTKKHTQSSINTCFSKFLLLQMHSNKTRSRVDPTEKKFLKINLMTNNKSRTYRKKSLKINLLTTISRPRWRYSSQYQALTTNNMENYTQFVYVW